MGYVVLRSKTRGTNQGMEVVRIDGVEQVLLSKDCRVVIIRDANNEKAYACLDDFETAEFFKE